MNSPLHAHSAAPPPSPESGQSQRIDANEPIQRGVTRQHLGGKDAVAIPQPVSIGTTAFYATGFAAGFCMMGLEILAGPMLEPFFGEGKDVWAGIISVFILSLSVGYTVGGLVADRFDTRRALAFVLLGAGALYCLMPLYCWTLIDALHTHIHALRMGALITSTVLFFLPSALVGMVTPMLVKLVFQGISELGRTTGRLYAVAAVGNVFGVLLTNFVVVDVLGLAGALVGMGLILIVFGLGLLTPMRS